MKGGETRMQIIIMRIAPNRRYGIHGCWKARFADSFLVAGEGRSANEAIGDLIVQAIKKQAYPEIHMEEVVKVQGNPYLSR